MAWYTKYTKILLFLVEHYTIKTDIIWYYLFLQIKGNQLIGLVGRVFTNGPGDHGSIPGRVIPKT